MQIGLCISDPARLRQASAWGYDYVEIGARAVRPFEPDSAWHPRRRELEDAGIAIRALAGFIPGEARFVGPQVDWERTRGYVETVVGRAAELGVRLYGWGSPQSKSVPDGWPYSRAFEQIERAAHLIADVMARHDSVCGIEPINPRECNVIFYLTDAALVASSIGRAEIRVLPDYFHMALQGEPLEHVERIAPWIAHAHTSGPDRRFPSPDDPWDHRGFLRALRRAGYDRTISFESYRLQPGADYATEARAGAAFIRRLWDELSREE